MLSEAISKGCSLYNENIRLTNYVKFFAEDTCAVKGEPYKIGVVDVSPAIYSYS